MVFPESRTRVALTLILALPVHMACRRESPPQSATYRLAEPVEHLGVSASEPMLVEHPNGTLFVSGWGGGPSVVRPLLWKSDDGASWERVDVGTTASDEYGGADVDLAVARDGTVYFAVMDYDRPSNEGLSVAVGVSRDVGATWSWTYLSRQGGEDRPWVDVTPDGVAHVIWNDRNGVHHAVSTDQGRTWTEEELVHPQGGSSHFSVGPNGELAVRIKPRSLVTYDEGVDFVAVSLDGGESWQTYPAPGRRVWNAQVARTEDGVWRWVEPVAWDAAGYLYHLWSEGPDLWLARSRDRGATWESWVVAHRDDKTMYYPFLAARGEGELAATWFERPREEIGLPLPEGASLDAHVARIDVPANDGDGPVLRWSDTFVPDSWWFSGDRRDTAGEYFPVAFLSDGDLAVVSPIRNFSASRFGFAWRRILVQD